MYGVIGKFVCTLSLALLAGCLSFSAGRQDALLVGVAAAEFRAKEGRWLADAEELLRSACRLDRVLGSHGRPSAVAAAGAPPRSACADAFRPAAQRITLRGRDDKLEIEVHNLRTNARCRLVGDATADPSMRLGGSVRLRTTIFSCR